MRHVKELGGWIGAIGAVALVFAPAILFAVGLIVMAVSMVGALIGGDVGDALNLLQSA